MFGVMARAQIPDDKGGTRLVEVPVDLCVIHDSKSATEADAFAKAFTSRYMRAGVHAWVCVRVR